LSGSNNNSSKTRIVHAVLPIAITWREVDKSTPNTFFFLAKKKIIISIYTFSKKLKPSIRLYDLKFEYKINKLHLTYSHKAFFFSSEIYNLLNGYDSDPLKRYHDLIHDLPNSLWQY